MSNLLSCFWQSKKKRQYGGQPIQGSTRGRRRLSKENNEVIYVETGGYIGTNAENQPKFNTVRNVYRTETNSQSPQFERICKPEVNRQTKSYPASPERSLCKVYSFEQRPSLESQKLVGRKDSRGLMVYAANINTVTPRFSRNVEKSNNFAFGTEVNLPRRSTLTHGVDYEKEVLAFREGPRCVAEKPAEEMFNLGTPQVNPDIHLLKKDTGKGDERYILRSKDNNDNFSPRSSKMENTNLMILSTDNVINPSQIKTVVRARPQSSKHFTLGSSVKPMVYRADDVRSSISARNKEPPILTTADGKILKPLPLGNARRMSSPSSRGSQQIRLSVVQPVNTVEGFPLTQRGDVIVAAPMIGGGGGGAGMRRGARPQKVKSILRKGPSGGQRGSPAPRRVPQVDDYDDYPYENDFGQGGQPHYDDVSDMYPMDDNYSYGSGYYDDGFGYPDDRYGRGAAMPRGGRQARHQVYAAQMPDITLPVASVDKGKNPPFKKIGKPLETVDVCIGNKFYDQENKDDQNEQQTVKEHKVKMISSAQQTDFGNELDFICFSPDRCYKTSEIPNDPNSKLRWRIIIKRGDEE